jgi:hypothetical protein
MLAVAGTLLFLLVGAAAAACWLFLEAERLKEDLAQEKGRALEARAEAHALQRLLRATDGQADRGAAVPKTPGAGEVQLEQALQEARAAIQALERRVKRAEEQARDARAKADALRAQVAKAAAGPKDAGEPDGHAAKEGAKGDSDPIKTPPKEPAAEGPGPAAEKVDSYEAIDRHALQAPPEAEASPETLAAYLTKPARNPREKARAIFRWITDRVAYDAEGFFSGRYGDNRAEAVLRNRKAVCEGFANLFELLCRHAGVEAVKIRGSAKGVGYVPGTKGRGGPHAWNAVRLDGTWQLVDATWGAGGLTDKRFTKRFEDYYFLTSPEQLIFTHLPADATWQLLARPLSAAAFEAQPRPGKELFKLGFTAADLRRSMEEPHFREFAVAFAAPGKAKVRQAPLQRHLQAGLSYTFGFESADFAAMAVVGNGQWSDCERRGSLFEVAVRPQPGPLRVFASLTPKSARAKFQSLLEYTVESKLGASPAAGPGKVVHRAQGRLTRDDPVDRVRQTSHQKTHALKMAAGRTYAIDLHSDQFDSYLRLEDSEGHQLAEDDDGGGFPHARITFAPTRTDIYRIIVTTFNPDEAGAYTLTVRE